MGLGSQNRKIVATDHFWLEKSSFWEALGFVKTWDQNGFGLPKPKNRPN